MARSKIATAEAIFWEAIVASAMRARTMPPTLQNTRAQRNAALASSSSTGHVVNVRFSNRPVWVKRFQTIHCCSVDVARGLVLLSGIGSWALPSWGSRTGWTNLLGGLAVGLTVGPADIAISPHPSSREGHHATAWWSSRFSYRVWLYTALTLQRRFCSSGTRCHQPRCGA